MLLAVVVYLPALGGPAVYDDEYLLSVNPRIFTMTFAESFRTDYWADPDQRSWKSMHYRPLALMAYAGIYHLFGVDLEAFHGANILSHTVATGAFFLLLAGLEFPISICLTAAGLFAVHPVHVEAVAWISGMPETLATALCLSSLACLVYRRHAASWILAGVAMLVKETFLTLPLMAFSVELYRQHLLPEDADGGTSPPADSLSEKPPVTTTATITERVLRGSGPWRRWRVAGLTTFPYVFLGVAYLQARASAFPPAPPGLAWLFLLQGPPVIAGAAVAYTRLLFFPWPLALSYGLPDVAWRWMVLGIVAAALAAAWRAARLRKQLFLAAAWIIFPLLLPILASPFMNDWTQVQDRYAYWAAGGACLLVVLALKSICERVWSGQRRSQGLAIASLLLICLCALGTWRQTTVWGSTEALWRHALQVTPASHWASNVLAKDLMRSKQYDAAVQVLDRALRYHPRNSDSELLMKMAQHQGR